MAYAYDPDRDPDIILLRLNARRAELAHWRAVARRWWATLAALSGLYTTLTFLGVGEDLQVVAGVAAIAVAVATSFWHEGMTKGVGLRRSIEEAERDHLAAVHRAEHEAAEAIKAAAEPPVPTTTRLLIPGRIGEVLTEVISAHAITWH